jgi:DNA-binding response OmpR family regulator
VAKKSLLLVDADSRSVRMLEVSLRKGGFSVTTAGSAEDAAEKLRHATPDLILSDTKLPGGTNGFDFVASLQRRPEHASIPVMFLSSEVSVEQKIAGLELGVEDYLTKPIYIKEVLTRVRVLLDKRDQQTVERRERTGSFSGHLGDMGLVDLMQTVELGRKTGRMLVHAGRDRGQIAFRDGKVVHARCGRLVGERAFYRMLVWGEGTFSMDFVAHDEPDVIGPSTQALLMEGVRRVDEWGRLAEQLPPVEHTFELDFRALAERLAQIPDEVNALLRAFDGRRSLLQVIDQTDFADLEALELASKLFFEGLIVDATARDAAATPAAPLVEPWLHEPIVADGIAEDDDHDALLVPNDTVPPTATADGLAPPRVESFLAPPEGLTAPPDTLPRPGLATGLDPERATRSPLATPLPTRAAPSMPPVALPRFSTLDPPWEPLAPPSAPAALRPGEPLRPASSVPPRPAPGLAAERAATPATAVLADDGVAPPGMATPRAATPTPAAAPPALSPTPAPTPPSPAATVEAAQAGTTPWSSTTPSIDPTPAPSWWTHAPAPAVLAAPQPTTLSTLEGAPLLSAPTTSFTATAVVQGATSSTAPTPAAATSSTAPTPAAATSSTAPPPAAPPAAAPALAPRPLPGPSTEAPEPRAVAPRTAVNARTWSSTVIPRVDVVDDDGWDDVLAPDDPDSDSLTPPTGTAPPAPAATPPPPPPALAAPASTTPPRPPPEGSPPAAAPRGMPVDAPTAADPLAGAPTIVEPARDGADDGADAREGEAVAETTPARGRAHGRTDDDGTTSAAGPDGDAKGSGRPEPDLPPELATPSAGFDDLDTDGARHRALTTPPVGTDEAGAAALRGDHAPTDDNRAVAVAADAVDDDGAANATVAATPAASVAADRSDDAPVGDDDIHARRTRLDVEPLPEIDRFGISSSTIGAYLAVFFAASLVGLWWFNQARPRRPVDDAALHAAPAAATDGGPGAGSTPDAGVAGGPVVVGGALMVDVPGLGAGLGAGLTGGGDAGPATIVNSDAGPGPSDAPQPAGAPDDADGDGGADAGAQALPDEEQAEYDRQLKRAEQLARRGDFGRSVRAYRAALELRRDSVTAHLGLGEALYELDNLTAALTHLERARVLAPEDPQVYVLLGAAYQSADRKADAVQAYKRYLRLAPDGKLAHDVRAILRGLGG